jgi:hypothetical protein
LSKDRSGTPHRSTFGSTAPDISPEALGASTFVLIILSWSVNKFAPFFAETSPTEPLIEDFLSNLRSELPKELR